MREIKLFLILFLSFFINNISWSQIILDESTLNKTVAHQAFILEDPNNEITIDDLLVSDTFDFKPIPNKIHSLGATTSRWIIKFTITNPLSSKRIVLETARSTTDKAFLYEIKNKKVLKTWKSGDQIPFNDKTLKHRKNIYKIDIEKNQSKDFYLILESSGELINIPLIFWTNDEFFGTDRMYNLFHGFYFGILAFAVLIFFFFYLILKEKEYLYYIVYVSFMLMFQFSLEGFTNQFIFPRSSYFSEFSILITASGTVIFALIYASTFLKLKERSPGWSKFFKTISILIILVTAVTFWPVGTHKIPFIILNTVSVIGIISIVFASYTLKQRGYKINIPFFLGFITLVLGGSFFVIGNLGLIEDARVTELVLKLATGLEVVILSLSMVLRHKELQDEKDEIQTIAFENLELQVTERTRELEEKRVLLQAQNKNMLDSLKYAERIQTAILPNKEQIKSIFPESFVLYEPLEIVGGDLYFAESVTTKKGTKISLFAAIDCTGHGVPGAFLGFVGNNYLIQALKSPDLYSLGQVLDYLNEGVFNTLKIKSFREKGIQIRDGMDITICGLNHQLKKLYFAGAKNPIQILTKKENLKAWGKFESRIKVFENPEVPGFVLIGIRGNRQPIGYTEDFEDVRYETLELPIFEGDLIYSYSDGYSDQFGGPKNKKFGTKNFKKLLLEIHHLSMEDQKAKLETNFKDWKGGLENLDDVLVMGVRVKWD